MYIAQDAHASKCTYEKLVELEKYGNVPHTAVPGLPVIIYQEDGQKIIAYGTWSSLNSVLKRMQSLITLPSTILTKYLQLRFKRFLFQGKSLRVAKIRHSKNLEYHLLHLFAQENKYMFQSFNELKAMKQPKKLLL